MTEPLRKSNRRAWSRLRERILERDHHRCRFCGALATEVDHIIPVRAGGTDAVRNLASCCWECGHFGNVPVKLDQLEARGRDIYNWNESAAPCVRRFPSPMPK